jgi:CBS domain-containing protein
MRAVRALLKNTDAPWSLHPQESVFDALATLASHDVGALMVMEDDKLVGILSERDYTRKIALQGKSSRDTRVADIMTSRVLTVAADSRTEDCMALMSQKKIRHMPVVDGDKVLGMISIRDIMDEIIADQEATINQLQSYIAS